MFDPNYQIIKTVEFKKSLDELKAQLNADRTQAQQVSIHIRDQGPGIETHHLERIFEAFFSTKQRDGLGLGLSISQRIVQSFGGQLEVRNAPQGGAEFIIVLLIATTGS